MQLIDWANYTANIYNQNLIKCLVCVLVKYLLSISIIFKEQQEARLAFFFWVCIFFYQIWYQILTITYMDRARIFPINFLIHNLFQIFWWWVLCKIFQLAAPPTYLPRSITSLQCTYPKSILHHFLQSNCMTFELNYTFVKCFFQILSIPASKVGM